MLFLVNTSNINIMLHVFFVYGNINITNMFDSGFVLGYDARHPRRPMGHPSYQANVG